MFGFAEHNICWNKIPKQQQLAERTRGWWENSHWTTAFNKCDKNPIVHQQGGTGLVVLNKLSHQAMQPRSDELGLEWWRWVRLRGQAGCILRIVSAYRPCFSSGPLLTYQQHVRYLARINCTNSPKNRFLMDLEKAILEWQAKGDMVILIVDMNKDVRWPKIQKLLQSVGLVDGPTMQHRSPPATHNHGSIPINGIFLPIMLVDQCRMGYLEFREAIPSNHRALWLDIPAHYVCPLEKEASEQPLM